MMRQAARTLLSSRALVEPTDIWLPEAARSASSAACVVNRSKPAQDGQPRAGGLLAAALAGSAAFATTSHAEHKVAAAPELPCSKHPFIFYQYEVCPWCNKVKAVLDYHKIPYRTVEVHPIFKSELKFSEYKKVPVLVTSSGEQVNDSSEIIKFAVGLAAQPHAAEPRRRGWLGRKAAEPSRASPEEEARWREWADTTLVRLLTTNIYSTWSESYQAMRYIKNVDSFDMASRVLGYAAGGLIMYAVGLRLPKKYGLEGKDLRQELNDQLDLFADAVGSRPFLGGPEPNIADLQVFGMMRAISDTDTFRAMITTDKRIWPWWQRMIEAVGESARVADLPAV